MLLILITLANQTFKQRDMNFKRRRRYRFLTK